MSEKFRFFDPVMDEHGNYDREYNAQEFVEYFSALVTTGVMKGAGNQLTVTADNASMVTTLDTGIAFILGRYYENDTPLQHIHDTETVGKERIDRIVIRMDNNAGSRHVKSFVKKGVASTTPIPPALTQDGEVYEISVAQVKVVGGQTFISAENVTDERGTDIICPWAGSRILPNFDDVALQELQNKVDNMFSLSDGDKLKMYAGNLNNLIETGFYTMEGAQIADNCPITLSSLYRPTIEVFKGADDWIFQRFSYSNNQGNHIFIRGLVMGTWNAWKNITPKDTIEETGTNSNGQYIKYSDGTMICYKKSTRLGQYRSATLLNGGHVFPAEFIESPSIHVSLNWFDSKAEITSKIKFIHPEIIYAGNCYIHVIGSNFTNGDFVAVDILVIGRWKQ